MPSRFDSQLMLPPRPTDVVDSDLFGRVRAWCECGAFPRLSQPLTAASIEVQGGLDGVACELDGSRRLARQSRWMGRAWRLQLLLREHWPRHQPQPTDPWDCGWWREGALAAAQAFQPRRPSLLLLREPSASDTASLLTILEARCAAYARPVRVLVVSAMPTPDLLRL